MLDIELTFMSGRWWLATVNPAGNSAGNSIGISAGSSATKVEAS